MLKRTCLYSTHQKLGGKLIEFGGWEMPVQYTSITDEHLAVRNAAGIFDISHMGEVTVSGAAAVDFLNYVFTNDVRKISAGQGQYTLMCNERDIAMMAAAMARSSLQSTRLVMKDWSIFSRSTAKWRSRPKLE